MVHPAPDEFDAFYEQARHRLLLQTYALTGDLRASRGAVRNAFVVAWHHWPRVSRSEDPEGWVRPHAWRQARRRHTARLWLRNRDLDAEARATLAALGSLPSTRRRLLLLTHLADVSLDQTAREVALPREAAERELQTASATFAVERRVPSTDVRPVLEQLGPVLAGESWPRGSVLRHAGAARRRTHTAAGMVGAVVALALTGSAVVAPEGESGGVRPTLESELLTEPTQEQPSPPSLGPDDLVSARQVGRELSGPWRERSSGDNTSGDGLVVRCQQERFADPDGSAAAVRSFERSAGTGRDGRDGPGRDGTERDGDAPGTVVQLSELSRTEASARRAFERARGWYAGCAEPATTLGETRVLPTIGDGGWMFAMRSYRPDATMVVGVVRSGLFTHTLAQVTTGGATAARPVVRLLARAVDAQCGRQGAGSCAGIPRGEPRPPLPVPPSPSLVAEFDLPAVAGVPRPWVGTDAAPARVNTAATPCDETSFRGLPGNRTRTFLAPQAQVPDTFGLTESLARFRNPGPARQLVSRIRRSLRRCPADDPASSVRRLAGGATLSAWRVSSEVSDARSVRYQMAVVRNGRAVAQVGFVPAGGRTISDTDFLRLARRARERLPYGGPRRPTQTGPAAEGRPGPG